MNRHILFLATIALGLAPGSAHSQPRLGTIRFPTSAGPAAQREFETGVLWMHSFEYDSAAAAFRRAQGVGARVAATAAGDRETADMARKSLIAIWHNAEADVPELDAVRSARP